MAKGFKTGGRQKGTPNKTTLLNREKMQKVFDDEMDSTRFAQALYHLPYKDYVNVMMKMFDHLVPKANDYNTAEVPAEELKSKRILFSVPRIAEKEEVQQCRATDPEEAELAALIYPNVEGELPPVIEDLPYIRLPLSTKEEMLAMKNEVDAVTYARIVLWNNKHRERWDREDEEALKNNPNFSSGPKPQGYA